MTTVLGDLFTKQGWWLIPALKAFFVWFTFLNFLPIMIWFERKVSAFIQDRTGPNRAHVGPFRLAGIVHNIADVLKLIFKEDIIPGHVDRFFYFAGPFVVMTVSLITAAVVPISDDIRFGETVVPMMVSNLNVGILYTLGVASLGVYGIIFAGWGSNSKFSLLGGLRSSAQMISYEIPMGLAVVTMILTYGSVNLNDMAQWQGHLLFGFLPAWGCFVQPIACIVFIVSALAETNRTPFDLPEGESELVAGYHTEYSSMKFALFFMGEYVNMVVAGAVITTLFFGGWQIPWLPTSLLENPDHAKLVIGIIGGVGAFGALAGGLYLLRVWQLEHHVWGDLRDLEPMILAGGLLTAAVVMGAIAVGLEPWLRSSGHLPTGLVIIRVLVQVGAFLGKTLFFGFAYVWVRWTLPRFRYDQLMNLGWKRLMPLMLANVALTAIIIVWAA